MPARTHQTRHHLVRPPSKQILQIREVSDSDDYYDEARSSRSFGSASPTTSGAAHAVGSPDRTSGETDEDAANSAGRPVRSFSPSNTHHPNHNEDASSHNTHYGRKQRGGHATHRAMTASARRGGKSGRKTNTHGTRSCSSRACLSVPTTASRSPQHLMRGGKNASSPVLPGAHVRYYGPPPVTALVSPTYATPTSSNAVTDDHTPAEHSFAGDGAKAALSSQRKRSDVNSAKDSRGYGHDNSANGGGRTCVPSCSGSAAGEPSTTTATGAASPSTTTITPTATANGSLGRSADTPLTYAAVASASSCTSSLHGKRLPQSRVGFANFRKRTGCSANSSGNVSVGSTARSTLGTPATAGSPAHVLFPDQSNGNGYSTRGYCASSCGFPSVPLTPLTQRTPPYPPAAPPTGQRDFATSLPPGDVAAGTADATSSSGAAAGGAHEESGGGGGTDERGEGEGDGGESRTWGHHPQTSTSTTTSAMPPLPPSLHRHHPTNLFLRLPHAHAQCTDSDEEQDNAAANVVAVKAVNTAGAQHQQQHMRAAAEEHDAVNSSAAMGKKPQQQQRHQHTGPATAAKAAAALHLRLPPTATTTIASTTSTPCGPTVPHKQLQLPARDIANGGGGDAAASSPGAVTPTGPAPAALSNGASRGMHKVGSTLAFFNAVGIIPGLFLGAYSDAMDTAALAAHGISLVINCSLECPVTPAMANNPHHVRYLQCPLRDHSDEVISPFFSPVSQIIHEQLHRRQINLQRSQRSGTAASPPGRLPCASAAGGDAVRGADDLPVGCRCGCGGVVDDRPSTATEPPCADAEAEGDQTDNDWRGAQQQQPDRMLWSWTDEAENVWAVPTSPASPPLSVGGQPSLKEGKRETPRTPSSAAAVPWGRGSDGTASCCTSGSPSPMPGRTSTFPGVSAGSAPASVAAGTLTATAAAAPLTGAALKSNGFAPSAVPPTPLTVVDPRDCGGVLVHCRMGVSRSASFVMAYLILYGFSLANLEDTASLFVRFLERERTIIEEAGGRARFALDVAGSPAQPSTLLPPTTAKTGAGAGSPIADGRNGVGSSTMSTHARSASQRFASPLTATTSANLFHPNSLAMSGRFGATTVSSPTSSASGALTPAQTPLGARRPAHGFASWHATRANGSANGGSNNASGSVSSANNGGGGNSGTAGSPVCRRSSAVPVSSPLFLSGGTGAAVNGCGVASPRSATSASLLRLSTPITPLELCSRVCRPCHLLRLRERRLQQQAKKHLLISGQQQQREAEAEEQMMALAALSRMRGEAQTSRSGASGNDAAVTPATAQRGEEVEEELTCVDCGDALQYRGVEGSRSLGTLVSQCPHDPQPQRRESPRAQLQLLRPTPSSAPVVSHRGSRGRFGRGPTLLEAALDDDENEEEVDGEEEVLRACESPATTGLEISAPLRNAFSVSKASTAAAGATAHSSALATPLPARGAAEAIAATTPLYSDLFPTGGVSHGGAGKIPTAATTTNLFHNSCENSSMASSYSMYSGDLAPAMTFREAFDAVKKEKSDVNPNIGFVLALRELAGGGDFSFSTSL